MGPWPARSRHGTRRCWALVLPPRVATHSRPSAAQRWSLSAALRLAGRETQGCSWSQMLPAAVLVASCSPAGESPLKAARWSHHAAFPMSQWLKSGCGAAPECSGADSHLQCLCSPLQMEPMVEQLAAATAALLWSLTERCVKLSHCLSVAWRYRCNVRAAKSRDDAWTLADRPSGMPSRMEVASGGELAAAAVRRRRRVA